MTASQPDNEVIFHAARDISEPDRRRAYVREVCGSDETRIAHVEALLAAADAPDSLLDRPAGSDPEATLDQPTPESPGTVIGPYKLIEQIGEGGMGTVWMAQQTEPVKRLVAVKLIKAGMDSKQVIARFEAERQALALMDHANIARVLDGGTSAGRPYFVMDLVKGVPITRYCDEHHLTPRQRLELFVPVCQAVQHAHQKGIIHRDLKPSNVLVALYDGKPVPKVIDFGVAKAAGQSLTDKTLVTGFGALVGTLEYMSPEQAEINQLDIDTRSDVYSLGVLLYELLTGGPPFTRKESEKGGMLELLRVIREQEPTRPSAKLSTAESLPTLAADRGTEPAKLTRLVKGELDWIVLKALEKDRSRRYDTANGFAADVQRYLNDESVLACPPSPGYRLRKVVRRNKSRVAVAGLILFFVVLLGGLVGWVLGDRSVRMARTSQQVEEALGQSKNLYRQRKLPEAIGVARNARALLDQGGEPHEFRTRLQEWLYDLEMAERLEEASLTATGVSLESRFDHRSTARAYAQAFRGYGIDVEALDPVDAAERIRQRLISESLTVALDYWASLPAVGPDLKKRLITIANIVDTDLWRRQVRAAAKQDGESLKRLAASPEALGQAPSTLIVLGSYLHSHGETEEAVGLLRNAHGQHPGEFWINYWLGYYLGRVKPYDRHLDEALRYLTAAVTLRPQSPGARLTLGMFCRSKRLYNEAISRIQEAIRLNPGSGEAYLCLGDALLAQGLDNPKHDVRSVLAALSRGIELDSRNPLLFRKRAGVYRHLQQWDKALDDSNQAIALDPDNYLTWFSRAEAYLGMSQWEKAVVDYTRALDMDRTHQFARNGRIRANIALGHWDKVVEDLTVMIELFPKQPGLHLRRGQAHRHSGQFANALADFAQVIKQEPNDWQGWKWRGDTYAIMGQWKAAAEDHQWVFTRRRDAPVFWADHALAQSMLGNKAVGRKVLTDMVGQFRANPDPQVANFTVQAAVALPDTAEDPGHLVTLAERTASRSLLGAAHYRAGNHAAALDWFQGIAGSHKPRAWDLLFQAMAHHRLGHHTEAHACFAEAEEWIAAIRPANAIDPNFRADKWVDWQEMAAVSLLRAETEALLSARK